MEKLQGLAVVPGSAMGPLLVLRDELPAALKTYTPSPTAEELKKLESAAATAALQLEEAARRCREAGQDEQAGILEAHQLMAQDAALLTAMQEAVGAGAPAAALEASEQYAAMFEAMDDAYLRERAADVRDVGKRIAKVLLGLTEPKPVAGGAILAAEDVEPSYLAALPAGAVKAVLLGQGSTTSHAVIIAKARGIPAIVGLKEVLPRLTSGQEVFVDAGRGEIWVEPDAKTCEQALLQIQREAEQLKRDLSLAGEAAVTTDGLKMTLAANIGSPQDMETAVRYGAEGVGLFRTEFLFMGHDSTPDEEEQYQAYKAAIEGCQGALCVIRTMDIGGDKPLHYLQVPKEDNPFLGWRAIRISLEREDLFLPQLKAILRAAVHGKAAIMLPMVSQVEEIRQARLALQRAREELQKEGKPFGSDVPLGIMVETPAAAAMASLLAQECDFFSIGTNDLVQYTLAVDRGNSKISGLYSHFHPAVLRLIQQTAQAAHEAGIWVGMCGEMAGDPLATPLLVAMGFDELSMSAPALLRVKERVRSLSRHRADELLAQALKLKESTAIRELLRRNMEQESES